mmetsp:Transcript_22978/g.39341  ORF Transcript_22978/g.39341 Transcript_22978/m.39341 type:complete len:216 (+) Transcript_22978:109-756(+)
MRAKKKMQQKNGKEGLLLLLDAAGVRQRTEKQGLLLLLLDGMDLIVSPSFFFYHAFSCCYDHFSSPGRAQQRSPHQPKATPALHITFLFFFPRRPLPPGRPPLPRRPPSSSVEGDAGLAYPLLQAADRLLVHLHQLLVNVLLDGLHLWDVVHHHVLHPVLERDGGAGAAAAGPGQLHPHRSRGLVELVEEDVPSVLLHGRADALLEQLLDHHHHL